MNSYSAKFTQFALSFTFLAIGLIAVTNIGAQQLQKGVSVQLAPTVNAQPMPAADDVNAWIVTVSQDGHMWFGAKSVDRASLVDQMIRTPRIRHRTLYIKADARSSYGDVEYVLRAARFLGFAAPVLLTAQAETSQPAGSIVPPMGLEVWIPSDAWARADRANVEVVNSDSGSPMIKLNDHSVAAFDLPGALAQMFQGQAEKVVELRAPGKLPFGDVAQVIDACRSTGARVVLVTPEV